MERTNNANNIFALLAMVKSLLSDFFTYTSNAKYSISSEGIPIIRTSIQVY